jgi:hypothetical protein
MADKKMDSDFSYNRADNSHYSVPSMYGKMVREQYNKQPRYCEPGDADGMMRGAHSNPQKGP